MRLALLALFLGALSLSPSFARAETSNDIQVWTALLGSAKLSQAETGPSLWLDLHLRRGEGSTVHIARPGVGYRVAPWLSLWVGYGYIPTLPDSGDTRHEHRLWQQAILGHKLDRWTLQSRTRLEQRFVDAGDDVGHRVRQFVRAGYKLDESFGLVAWDELFVGLADTDWNAPTGLDQNRLFLGGSVQIRKELRLEMGYLSVFLNRGDSDTLAYVAATNLFVSL